MTRRVLFAGLVVLAATGLRPRAQSLEPPPAVAKMPADPDAIRALIDSSDPRDEAWGAWVAGRDQLETLVPDLERQAARLIYAEPRNGAMEPTGAKPISVALDVVLDALIQLHAKTSPDWLRAAAYARPIQALILLSYDGADADTVLEAIAEHSSEELWFASEDLLLSRRAPGTALTLLRGLAIEGIVFVSVDGKQPGWGYGGTGGGAPRWPAAEAPGFPPIARYASAGGCFAPPQVPCRLQPESVVLATGPMNVFYIRVVAPGGHVPAIAGGYFPDQTNADRIRYLAALLSSSATRPQPLPLQPVESEVIAWRDQPTLDAEVARFRADIVRRYAEMIDLFEKNGLLTLDEASTVATPSVAVRVDWLR